MVWGFEPLVLVEGNWEATPSPPSHPFEESWRDIGGAKESVPLVRFGRCEVPTVRRTSESALKARGSEPSEG